MATSAYNWAIYLWDFEAKGWERVGIAKTLRAAEALAAKKLKRKIHGWFAVEVPGSPEALQTWPNIGERVEARLVRGFWR
jgi:hypothetical protein